jgi:16S rRNA (guanine527-N7)-methyltransferase
LVLKGSKAEGVFMADAVTPRAPQVAQAADADAAAATMFGEALPRAVHYAELLTGVGVDRGVVGPSEAERIWDRHLLNCGALARVLPAKGTLVDLGSGAGLPGIVLAILLPGMHVTLLEAMARRVEFLEMCVAELGLANAEVVRSRAEDLAGHIAADVVTARAVAPLDKLAGLCVGLCRPGGRVLAMKGVAAENELARARPVLGRLGVSDARVVELTSADGQVAATVVTFTAPDKRTGGQAGGRAAVRATTRPTGRPTGQPGYSGSAAGRKTRPNSRRSGG